ncbi:DUF4082 domain-containing protein [Cellulomonas sp. Leaf334]|uniref:DUF4082 domain-containing protein n=1 Tax=Cellulomonas sp. Leaf334 TaxID=1736339 RepID=UPI0006FCCA48|nr:DUF4082 domain-containing protein [Cellulomonas sp. Leaf334]KQR12190.1 hypothetical protein ASF78_13640 [Cellulomonas sp. Leaf334]
MSSRPVSRRLVGLVAALATGASLVVVAATPGAAADPCATGGNPIVCENSRTGTDPDVWDIDGAGDEGIQGYATDISVNVGSTVQFKIKTDAVNYDIDIYRTGWYGGDGARFITSVPSPSVRQNQPGCVSDDDTGNYDCGNWAVSASWAVPTTAVSGVYLAKLTDPVTDDTSHITFVVRNDASTSAVVFQTSDTTWHAYNTYGGSSFYQGGAVGRAYKLSYNRPFATRNWEQGRDFYFSSEYAMVRFLERNGYDVSYLAGVDSDRRGALIKNHKVFMSVGHDEYWSGAQRANIEAARDAGVNLAFFSGNEAYWRTRYESSIAGTPTAYRTLTSYKETWSNQKVDDTSPEWTGTWRDPRFASPANGGGRPENNLTGTMYTSNFSDLPVTVSADEGKYRLWRNTSLTSLSSGTKVALAPHTIGYESNEDVDNGARPQGLVRLSTTTGLVPQYLQDFGNVVAEGTTTHHLTLYRAPSGALVFSAGSIQWAWGLDQEHDGDGAAADPRMQQATVNLLADMKAQPGSLMTGLVAATASSDTTGPVATISSPASGASIANGTSVTVSGVATDVGGRVAGVEVSTDAGASWHPATGTTAWSYTYVQSGNGSTPVRVRAVDDSANIGAVATRSFTVACPCSLFGSAVPKVPAANDPDAVELGLKFSATANGFVTGVRFYKGAGNTGTHVGSLWSSTGARLATATFQNETSAGWQTAVLSPAVEVTAGTTYVVSYTAPAGHYAMQDDAFWYRGVSAPPLLVAGGFGASGAGTFGAPGTFPAESFRSTHYFVDVVYSSVDTTPLTISGQSPLGGSTSVPVGSPVSVVLSKAVTAGSVAMTLTAQGGSAVAGTTSYDATTRRATFTPSAALGASTVYTASVSASANGAGITGPSTWSFTTAAPPQVPGGRTVSFYDDSAVPATLQDPDTDAVTLGTRFASSVDGTVTGVRFYKGPNNTGTHVGQLWAVGGSQPLAQATFGSESTSGWQTVLFATPVRITKDTEYIVAYRAPVGRYSSTAGAFSGTGLQRAPLRTEPMSGAYTYATGYPGSSSTTSYLVDVVFTQDAAALAVTAQSPAAADPGASVSAPVSVTFNAPLAAGATLSLRAGTAAVAGTATRSSDARTLVFTPSSALARSTVYTATASSLVSTDGSTLADVTWSFTTAAADNCPCTLFSGLTPATSSVNDSSAVELGVSFSPTSWGVVTGVRFYKGAGNTGTHTGTLWSSSGQLLRTVTFADESASGWQTALFSSPYQVAPGTTYVVSYHAPQGHYAATPNDFTVNRTVGPLTTPAVGNGRYRYGSGGVAPTETWQQTNYFVDVVFATAAPDLPTVSAQAPPAGATGISTSASVGATLSVAPASGSPAMALSGPFGTIAGESSYDPTTRRVMFTPSSALPAGSSISVATTLAGTPLAGGSWTFTTAAATGSAVSLWTDSEVPTVAAWNDPDPVMVGTRFTASAPGAVTAIRFYKGATNTGTHTVSLWDAAGVKVAEAPSSAESASGWQTVPLTTPAVLVPGQVYTAAYHSTSGRYAVTSNGLAAVRTVGPLSTVATGGAYVYGTTFPASSTSTFFGVDLVFAPAG